MENDVEYRNFATATHEAGHALAALCLKLQPLRASIWPLPPELYPRVIIPEYIEPPAFDLESFVDWHWRSLIFDHCGIIAEVGWSKLGVTRMRVRQMARKGVEGLESDDERAKKVSFELAKCFHSDDRLISMERRIYHFSRREARGLLRQNTSLLLSLRAELLNNLYLDESALRGMYDASNAAFSTSFPSELKS